MKPYFALKEQQGFTLVELMISLVLGLVVVLGVSQVYLTTLQTSRAIADVAARREVISYFSSVVGDEVRASFDAFPVSGNAAVSTSGNLQINFKGDASSPVFSEFYCPASEDLQALEYFSEADAALEDGYLVVVPLCSASGLRSKQRVLSGVEGVLFSRGADDRFIDVVLTLSSADNTFSGAEAEKNAINMKMVSRSVSIFD